MKVTRKLRWKELNFRQNLPGIHDRHGTHQELRAKSKVRWKGFGYR